MHNPFKDTCDLLASAIPTRRQVLQVGLAASAMLLTPWQVWAKVGKSLADLPERTISLYNTHTGELLSKFVYWQDGNYIKDASVQVDRVVLDPAQSNRHVTESQGRQGATGACFHPVQVRIPNRIGQIVEPAGLHHESAHAAASSFLKALQTRLKKAKTSWMEIDQIFPGIFAEIEFMLVEPLHVRTERGGIVGNRLQFVGGAHIGIGPVRLFIAGFFRPASG
jgi:hypothetical protein